jgi:hypothetical protein
VIVVVAKVEVPVTVKRPVVVAFTKLVEVAKRLDEVELVVLAFTAAKSVEVELVNDEEVANTLVPMKLVENISLKRLA